MGIRLKIPITLNLWYIDCATLVAIMKSIKKPMYGGWNKKFGKKYTTTRCQIELKTTLTAIEDKR